MGLISRWKYPWLPNFRLKFSNLSNLFLNCQNWGAITKILLWSGNIMIFQAVWLLKWYTRSTKKYFFRHLKKICFDKLQKAYFWRPEQRMTNSSLFNSSHQGKQESGSPPTCSKSCEFWIRAVDSVYNREFSWSIWQSKETGCYGARSKAPPCLQVPQQTRWVIAIH